jgi:GNAT superfamily N-acetyltransferase
MNFSSAEAERLADAIEAAASRDLYDAAPAALRLRAVSVGGATALVAPTLPVTYFNRVIGLGNQAPATADDIDSAMSVYAASGVSAYWIHLVPSARPPDLTARLVQRGFAPAARRSWAKFLRGVQPPTAPRSDLVLRAASPADASAAAAVVCTAYGMPATVAPWFAALVGRPGWQVWIAEREDRIVATGSLFVRGDFGWLGAAATLAEHRGQGAQRALLAARIDAAARAGCRVVATETGEAVDAEPNPSLANIRRVGFTQVCSRLNYAAPATTPGR